MKFWMMRVTDSGSCWSTFVYGGQAAKDQASCVTSRGNVTTRRSVTTGDVRSGQVANLHSRRPCGPRGARRDPTLPSDRSPRNYRCRRQRCLRSLRSHPRLTSTFCCLLAAEAEPADQAADRRTSTIPAGTRPPTNYRGTRGDSARRRRPAVSKWRFL